MSCTIFDQIYDITHSHGSATKQVNGKFQISTPRHAETP